MTFKTLRYVLAVAELGSFSAAARQLYLSQPSLSQSILALERETGAVLFDRSQNPLRLTPAGERFVATARKILTLEAGLMAELGAMSVQGGPLRVAAGSHHLGGLVADVYRRFLKLHPGAAVTLLEAEDGELARLARSGQADLVLLEGELPHGLAGQRVRGEELVLAVAPGHPLTAELEEGEGLPLERLERERFVLPATGSYLRACVQRLFEAALFRPQVLAETRWVGLMLEYARLGLAVAPVYRSSAMAMGGGLALFPAGESVVRTDLFLCHRPGVQQTPAMQEFLRLALQQPAAAAGGKDGG